MAVDLASLLQSGLVQGVLLLGQGLDVGVQLGRQLVLAVGGLLLPLDDLPRQVGMAALALLHDGRILGGVHQVVGAVLGAVLGLGGGHVAVGAGVALLGHGGLRAAVDSLELGVLGLQHGGAGLGVLPILEAHLVVVGENGLGGHALEPRVGIRGGLGLGGEVVLVVALAAHLGIGGDLIHIGTHGIHEELLGDRGLRRVVLMAVVAADGLGHLHEHLGEGLLVGRIALGVHHGGVLGRLAGDAVGQRVLVHAGRLGHGLQAVGMPRRLVVALGEAVAGVHGHQLRVLGQVVLLALGAVGLVGHIGLVLVGVDVLPRFRHHDAEGIGLGGLGGSRGRGGIAFSPGRCRRRFLGGRRAGGQRRDERHGTCRDGRRLERRSFHDPSF